MGAGRQRRLLDAYGDHVYRPASVWESIPPYLQFLARHALLGGATLAETAGQLRALQPRMERDMADLCPDPVLVQALHTCWDRASL